MAGTSESLRKYEPVQIPEEWFLDPYGIHGIGHTQRVYQHAVNLTKALCMSEKDASSLLLAALWHDIGREDDSENPDHGRLSVNKAKALNLHQSHSQEILELTFCAIENHSKDDAAGELGCLSTSNPQSARTILWALKDADALDRVRFWGLDPTCLRFAWSGTQIPYAEELLKMF